VIQRTQEVFGRTLRDGNGQFVTACPGYHVLVPLQPDQIVYLGTYGGHQLFTNDLKRLSDLVLFILGAIPNTTGSHILDRGTGASAVVPKESRQQFFSIGGQTGVTIPSKP
jgi:hypothetical protein